MEDLETGTPSDAISRYLDKLECVREEVAKVFVGHTEVVDDLLICLLSRGHALIEGVPGLGKTLLAQTVGAVFGLHFARIQFTPDLMPSDVTGAATLQHDAQGRVRVAFQPGPIFAQMVLIDEINRATPKTQSALLEAMQEKTVTSGGETHALPDPFFVIATQNPIEMEGTYPLPEAQADRFFFKVIVPYPSAEALDAILDRPPEASGAGVTRILSTAELLSLQSLVRAVPVASHVRQAIIRFLLLTQPSGPKIASDVQTYVRLGISPRGGQALLLAAKAHALLRGRYNVAYDDVQRALGPALRHRLGMNFQAQAEGVTADMLLGKLWAKVT